MSYTNENLKLANQIISDRKQRAEKEREKRHAEVKSNIPDFEEYEKQMAQSGLAVLNAISMGKDAKKYIEELSEVNLRIQKFIKDELTKHGYPEDYLETPYTCKKCEDFGYKHGKVCSCRIDLLNKLTLADLHNSSPARNCTFENFSLDYYSGADEVWGVDAKERMSQILEYCKNYAEDFDENSGSLYFHGATGLGKTHLSLAIANVVAANGYNIIYGSAQSLLSELEKEYFSYNKTDEFKEKLYGCDLLIIDDLGSEFSTQFTLTQIYEVINQRLNLSKPTIISTNLSDVELEKRYEQRVASRIIGHYTALLFVGKDVRQIK